MPEEVYISSKLRDLLDSFQEFGDFSTRVRASEVLAIRVRKLPVKKLLPDREKEGKEIEGAFVRVKG